MPVVSDVTASLLAFGVACGGMALVMAWFANEWPPLFRFLGFGGAAFGMAGATYVVAVAWGLPA